MTTNFYSTNSRPFALVRNYSPAIDRFFFIKHHQRNPKAKDSRPTQKIIMKQMDQNINYKLKLISCGIEIQKNQWTRKIQSVYGNKRFSKTNNTVIKDFDKTNPCGGEILIKSVENSGNIKKECLSGECSWDGQSLNTAPINSNPEKKLKIKNIEPFKFRRTNIHNRKSKSIFAL